MSETHDGSLPARESSRERRLIGGTVIAVVLFLALGVAVLITALASSTPVRPSTMPGMDMTPSTGTVTVAPPGP